jgi:hypothetical protein
VCLLCAVNQRTQGWSDLVTSLDSCIGPEEARIVWQGHERRRRLLRHRRADAFGDRSLISVTDHDTTRHACHGVRVKPRWAYQADRGETIGMLHGEPPPICWEAASNVGARDSEMVKQLDDPILNAEGLRFCHCVLPLMCLSDI